MLLCKAVLLLIGRHRQHREHVSIVNTCTHTHTSIQTAAAAILGQSSRVSIEGSVWLLETRRKLCLLLLRVQWRMRARVGAARAYARISVMTGHNAIIIIATVTEALATVDLRAAARHSKVTVISTDQGAPVGAVRSVDAAHFIGPIRDRWWRVRMGVGMGVRNGQVRLVFRGLGALLVVGFHLRPA